MSNLERELLHQTYNKCTSRQTEYSTYNQNMRIYQPRKGCNSLWAGVPGGGKQEEPYHLSNPGPLPTLSPLFLYPESLGSQGRHDDFSLYPAL